MRLASRPTSRSSTTSGPLGAPIAIASSASLERVADGHALARGQPVGLDHDARARRGELLGEGERRRAASARTSPARAIGTPAAAATSWQNALLDSIRAAAGARPEDRDARPPRARRRPRPPAAPRVRSRRARRRRPGRPRRPTPPSSGSTSGRQRTRGSVADRVAAGRDEDRVDAGLAGELPGEGVLAAAAPDDEDARRHHERRRAHAGIPGRRRIGRQARSMVWVRSGPTETSTIGTPACSSMAVT